MLLCLCLAACGSDDDDGGGGGGATIVIGGAASGTLPALAVASKSATDNFYTVGVSIVSPHGGFTSASASFRITGSPAAGTFAEGAIEVGALEVSTSDGKSWTAFSTPVIGTVGTLTLSSVSAQGTASGITLYTVHGSLSTSTLVPGQGGANVTMTSTF